MHTNGKYLFFCGVGLFILNMILSFFNQPTPLIASIPLGFMLVGIGVNQFSRRS